MWRCGYVYLAKTPTTATRKEKFMGEKQQLYKIIQNDTVRRTASDCRLAIPSHNELLKFDRQDKRTRADRRNGNGKGIKSVYTLKW